MNDKSPVKIFVIVGSIFVVILIALIIICASKGSDKSTDEPIDTTVSISSDNSGFHKLGDPTLSVSDPTSVESVSEDVSERNETVITEPSTQDVVINQKETPNTEITNSSNSKNNNNIIINSIQIVSLPKKTSYYIGDKLSLNGIAVFANYSDGSQKNVTQNITHNSPDMYKSGKTSVVVYYKDGSNTKSATFSITIKTPSVSINQSEKSINVNETFTLSATVSPPNCDVKWVSASGKIASVNQNGLVKGVGTGKTTVTASIVYNGITYYSNACLIAVTKSASTITITDLDWDGEYSSDELIVDYVYGTISSNYEISYIEVGLIGPAYVNGKYVDDNCQYFYLEKDAIESKKYYLDDFGECDFDIILDEEYTFYVYAEDEGGGSYVDGWSWYAEE